MVTPPDPTTVAVTALPRVTGGLALRRVLPRYRTTTTLPTREMPAVSPPSVRGGYCFICGAAVPPWRACCWGHDARLGRGLPPPVILHPIVIARPDHLPDSNTGTTLAPMITTSRAPKKSQLPG